MGSTDKLPARASVNVPVSPVRTQPHRSVARLPPQGPHYTSKSEEVPRPTQWSSSEEFPRATRSSNLFEQAQAERARFESALRFSDNGAECRGTEQRYVGC